MWEVHAGVQADCEDQGKAKLVVLANNSLALRESEIEYCAVLAKTCVIATLAIVLNWA
jgi:ribosomal protein L30E